MTKLISVLCAMMVNDKPVMVKGTIVSPSEPRTIKGTKVDAIMVEFKDKTIWINENRCLYED